MDALIQLRSAVADARTAQARTQSELAQAVANLQKWETRQKLTVEENKSELASATTSHKLIYQKRVKSLTALANENAETVSRLEGQLTKWEDVAKSSARVKKDVKDVNTALRAVPGIAATYELSTEFLEGSWGFSQNHTVHAVSNTSSQQLQERQDALNEKINKLTALLFDVQQEFQTLKKDIEKNSLTEENQEIFSDIELEKLRILLDEL